MPKWLEEPYTKKGKLKWQFILYFIVPFSILFIASFVFASSFGFGGFVLWVLLMFIFAAAGGE